MEVTGNTEGLVAVYCDLYLESREEGGKAQWDPPVCVFYERVTWNETGCDLAMKAWNNGTRKETETENKVDV